MGKEPPDLSYYKCIKTSLKSIDKNDFVISKINDIAIIANKIHDKLLVYHSKKYNDRHVIYYFTLL